MSERVEITEHLSACEDELRGLPCLVLYYQVGDPLWLEAEEEEAVRVFLNRRRMKRDGVLDAFTTCKHSSGED